MENNNYEGGKYKNGSTIIAHFLKYQEISVIKLKRYMYMYRGV